MNRMRKKKQRVDGQSNRKRTKATTSSGRESRSSRVQERYYE